MITIANANALHIPLADQSVQCVVTSPPYYGLRDYGTAKWEGGSAECDHVYDRTLGMRASTLGGGKSNQPYGSVYRECPRCGARRIDAQIGLEPTPAAYVASIVAVMRECWRVLKDDGVLWLNIGDSYAQTTIRHRRHLYDGVYESGGFESGHQSADGLIDNGFSTVSDGLKPKDLCGIPWRVAFALQQPWHTGPIKDERDRYWLAGLVDGEGCLTILETTSPHGSGNSYPGILQIRMTDARPIERVALITGYGSVSPEQQAPSQMNQRPVFHWRLNGRKASDVAAEIYPYLFVKKKQAIILWNHQAIRESYTTKRGVTIPQSALDKQILCRDLIQRLNDGEDVDIPSWMNEPDKLESPGWYLRQDLIWHKPNPMPESVTDRCTKAHEYIFLLTKRARYYYDAEAIKEEQSREWIPEKNNPGKINGDSKSQLLGIHPGEKRSGVELSGFKNYYPSGRNRRSVWTVATSPYSGAHFATFPPALIEPMILAGTSARGECPHCGKAWARDIERVANYAKRQDRGQPDGVNPQVDSTGWRPATVTDNGWQPQCSCPLHEPIPQTVLDPFAGSGTTGAVAVKHGRRAVLLDLNTKYIDLQFERTNGVQMMFETIAPNSPSNDVAR